MELFYLQDEFRPCSEQNVRFCEAFRKQRRFFRFADTAILRVCAFFIVVKTTAVVRYHGFD